MPEFKNAVPGNFCWTEVASNDPAASRKFYAALFGWNVEDMPGTPEGMSYGVGKIGDANAAGITALAEEAKKMGQPPQWLSYVATADAKATLEKVVKLGGKVHMGPIDAGPGVMAIIADPSGAVLGIWEEKQTMGTFVYGETGALCWNELMTTDVDRAGKFYVNLFGWKAENPNMGNVPYTTFKNGETYSGGMMAQPKEMAGAPSMWTVYFAVKDVDAALAKAKSLGARPVGEVLEVKDVGRMGFLVDPQGASFALLQPAPQPTK